ncbi:carbonyl reductase [NADPH] 1 [Eurytemora carolleeae]|uniref:carbonyl reductase [NADPH] 1 n=1 Tax=Eurytemora carolleeae TaxID=1294199 RepID=UPI000C77B4B6|nr:carbonyl reductase [NADPH] 1 [Eurytemora carolleeae]|eukprot:XP_023343745.1 carbonyl reductase [NADPH] 1-like [Eurytemora affinis]
MYNHMVVRELLKLRKSDDIVYLTARNSELGKVAVKQLKEEGLEPAFFKLDITSQNDIDTFASHVKTYHAGLDVLINNAGIAFKNSSTEPFPLQAKVTIDTNYFGTLNVCEALFPLLRKGSRVVNVSSSCGHLSKINGEEPQASKLRNELSKPDLTVDQLNQLMASFVKLAEDGEHIKNGWPNGAYKVSKVGVSALSIIQQ